jgi:hypothetical protein
MEEIFKTIKGYETLYEISNLGRVKNLTSGKILKNTLIREYYVIQLRNKKRMKQIHVLIAKAFIPNPENKPKVYHIDRDRTNNDIGNLMWVTTSESKSINNTSGYSGVSFNKNRNKWEAELKIGGRYYYKLCKTKEEAIKYRAELERIHFGIYSPKPVTIINNITNNITIQNVQTFNNNPIKTEAQEIEELERELENSMK